MNCNNDLLPFQTSIVMVGGRLVKLKLERSISSGAEQLIWKEFFESRQRGINWDTHLSWTMQEHVFCVSAEIESYIVGALLIKCVPNTDAAMIGYVCVHLDHRGHRLSGALIDFAASAMASSRLNQLILWTGKPLLYQNNGFITVAREQCIKLKLQKSHTKPRIKLLPWPSKKTSAVGLPPFATAGWLVENTRTSIIFVDTSTGSTLLDFKGVPKSVIETMTMARSGIWSVTLDAQDEFVVYATKNNLVVDQSSGPVTMVRQLNESRSALVKISLIERI